MPQLAVGEVDALILDAPYLRYWLENRTDLLLVGKMFQYSNL